MYAFYRVPKLMVKDRQFSLLSAEAKLAYGMLLDRMDLSARNGWQDNLGRIYIIYSIEELMEDFNVGSQKAVSILKELETFGLIEKKRQGFGKPNLIFVKNFFFMENADTVPSQTQNGENHNSRMVKITNQEFPFSQSLNCENQSTRIVKPNNQELRKSKGNNTDSNDTDVSNTESNISNRMIDIPRLREKIKNQIEYGVVRENLTQEKGYNGKLLPELLDEVVEIMIETAINQSPTIKIGAFAEYPTVYVQERFSRLRASHIVSVIFALSQNSTEVKNSKSYILATLFNIVTTLSCQENWESNNLSVGQI